MLSCAAIVAGLRTGSAACSKMIVSVRARIDSISSISVPGWRTAGAQQEPGHRAEVAIDTDQASPTS